MPEQFKPKRSLVDLDLTAVALVAEGANSRAHILLNKTNKRKENTIMTFEELVASLKPEQAELINKRIKLEQDAHAETKQTVEQLNARVAELEKAIKATEEPPKEVLKNLDPTVKEMFEKMQKTINDLVTDKAEALAASRFEKCKAIPVEEAQLKEVLKSASPTVVEVLEKAAAAIVEKAHSPAGTSTSGEFSQEDQGFYYGILEKAAQKLQKENPAMTFEQAFDKACTENSDVFTKYVKGVK